jgi:large conductance mechanosensitive channel
MRILGEFKAFAMRGNVIDLAVGIVIGGAFGKIVSALVANIIMPPIGWLLGNVDFSNLRIVLKDAAVDAAGKAVPEVAIGYGLFVNTIIDFLIIALAIFLLVKGVNSLKRKEEAKPAPPPGPTRQELLLGEIRDLLKARS